MAQIKFYEGPMHLFNQTQLKEIDYVFINKKIIPHFIRFLQEKGDVFAPHKKGEKSFAYKKVSDPDDVVLDYARTIQPLKKYFIPPRETLLNFNLTKNSYERADIEETTRIFLGVHSFDMQAIQRLDYSFKEGNPESNYLSRRESSIFIGVSYAPDKYHFGKSVGIDVEKTDGLSLYMEPADNGYFVFIIDGKGRDLIDSFGKASAKEEFGELDNKHFIAKIKYHYNRIPRVFDQVYHSEVWKKVADKCLGCGTCNLLCPTCYCFDVRDEVEIDAENGVRERFWDGCMLNSFAEVAGNENFREKLESRTRHRLYRKFKYMHDQSGQLSCVGCGRCSSFCPANIIITDIVNELIEDVSQKQLNQ